MKIKLYTKYVFYMNHYIVIDTETTGLPDYTKQNPWPKPISIGIVICSLINNEMNIYYEKEWYITDWVNELTDNTAKFLKLDKNFINENGTTFNIFKSEFTNILHVLSNIVFVAHNVLFDKNVLKGVDIPVDNYPWFCTMDYGTKYFKKYPKLLELATFYNIDISNDKAHRALYDAQICTHILYCILTNYKYTNIYNKRELYLRNRIVDYFF